jgi:TonB family protein
VVVPESKPFRSGKTLSTVDGDSSSETSSTLFGNCAGNIGEELVSLKKMVAAGELPLDHALAAIADGARKLTGASGAALAMWRDGAMVCRARSGNIAPPLGMQLNAETGISGKCLRTGTTQHCSDTENDPLVDLDVCRSLGLRSIAVLPIQGWRGVNGILEVFSTEPAAFSEQHLALLQQLSALSERARASQPHGASSSAVRKDSSADEKPQSSGLLPASDPVGDVALAFVGSRSRPFVIGGIGVLAVSLLGLMIWLGWRGADGASGKAHAAALTSVGDSASTSNSLAVHPPDDDPVWKPNPGGEPLFASNGKPSAGDPVKFASQMDLVREKKIETTVRTNRSSESAPLLADLAGKVADNTSSSRAVSNSLSGSRSSDARLGDARTGDSRSGNLQSSDPRSDETTSSYSPPVLASTTNPSSGNSVSSASSTLPASPVSQGVSGGQVLHRVEPVYPAQARLLRLEGTVVLAATVMEDGTVRDIKVVEGSQVLAQSAVDAVKHWRYQPFELDGKPVKNQVGINVDFKIPSDRATR